MNSTEPIQESHWKLLRWKILLHIVCPNCKGKFLVKKQKHPRYKTKICLVCYGVGKVYRIRSLILPFKGPADPRTVQWKRDWKAKNKDKTREYNRKTNKSEAHKRAMKKYWDKKYRAIYKQKYEAVYKERKRLQRTTDEYRAKANEYMKAYRLRKKTEKVVVDKDYRV